MKKSLIYLLAFSIVLMCVSFSASVFASEDDEAHVEETAAVSESTEGEANAPAEAETVTEAPAEEKTEPEEAEETNSETVTNEVTEESEPTEAAESTEPVENVTEPESTDPTEAADPAEPTEVTEATEPEETEPEKTEPEEEELIVNPDAEPYLNSWMVEADGAGNLNTTATSFALRIPSVMNGVPTSTIVANGFYGWSELTVVVIPANITYIGENAFAGCSNLGVIVLEGRTDACDISLGYNWNGGARVIFGLTVQESVAEQGE